MTRDILRGRGLDPVPSRILTGSRKVSGVGLHSGMPVTAVLSQGPPGGPVNIVRRDKRGCPEIAALAGNLVLGPNCTGLQSEGVRVDVVEHMLAAAYGLGVYGLRVSVDGPELPYLDGSSLPWVQAMREAGMTTGELLEPLQLPGIAEFSEGERRAIAVPWHECRISCAFMADRCGLADETLDMVINKENFESELAGARSPVFIQDIQELAAQGLIKGAYSAQAVMIGPNGIEGPVRYDKEIVRHKILDLLGDISVLGPIRAHITAVRPGHRINHGLVMAIQALMGGVKA